jgi:archaellum component FlaC
VSKEVDSTIKALEERVEMLSDTISNLSSGLIILSRKDLKESLSSVWDIKSREGEKIDILRKIQNSVIITGCISIAIATFILFLVLFTEPI